ncbi:hypothetical protein [Macrococcoides caseolyticum]|uniref:hypothetical protein n=1 Tax=Macrococcoides caseolyticum TaxID=69966 RepID=UPI001F377675|nr:hypothetical protein [Macrococcus caseolyticus]MCE4955983.1 hypothetical protein [Macrococcus caseolyticus]
MGLILFIISAIIMVIIFVIFFAGVIYAGIKLNGNHKYETSDGTPIFNPDKIAEYLFSIN